LIPKDLYIIANYIVDMATTIQVSEELEDTMELNEETKKEIEQARADIKSGKFYTHEQVKKKLGL
jgi:predicted transcriptional regulator